MNNSKRLFNLAFIKNVAKRCILLLMCALLVFQQSTTIFAKEVHDYPIQIKEYGQEEYLDEKLIAEYDEYDIVINNYDKLLDYINRNGKVESTRDIKLGTVLIYSLDELNDLVKEGDKLTNVEMFETGDIYVSYTSHDSKETTVRYSPEGLMEKTIYDIKEDKAVSIVGNSAKVYTDFRKGTEFTVSDELVNQIFELAEKEEWDIIDEIQGIEVIIDEDGTHYVEIALSELASPTSTAATGVVGFSSLSAMLSNLKSSFPTYTKQLYSTVYRTSNYLNKSVAVRLYRTRDTYVKTTANYRSFAISTALSVIASYLSVGSASIVASILDYLGYAYSTALLLQEAATLYKSVNYKYRAERYVYVYDSTVYNNYVQTYKLTYNNGTFAGGYTPSGSFGWVDQGSSIDNYNDNWLISVGFCRYELDLNTNGRCYSYQP